MKSLSKRIHNLEKPFDFNESDLSHLSDEELEARIEQLTLELGYRPAAEGEIPEGEINEKVFVNQGVSPEFLDYTPEQLDTHMRLGGYLPINGKETAECP